MFNEQNAGRIQPQASLKTKIVLNFVLQYLNTQTHWKRRAFGLLTDRNLNFEFNGAFTVSIAF